MSVTPNDVRMAYELLLGRAPDDDDTVSRGCAEFSSRAEMRRIFLASDEFHKIATAALARGTESWVFREIAPDLVLPLDLSDVGVSLPILRQGCWERFTTEFILSRVHAGMVFLDVGANIGWFSLQVAGRLRSLGGGGKVIAVEAQDDVAEQLRKAVAFSGLQAFVSLNAVAAGEKSGQAVLHRLDDGNRGGAYVLPAAGNKGPEITVTALDDLLAGIRRLDLVKIDVEGSEIAVLRGAAGLLHRFHPELVVEINDEALQRTSGLNAADLLRELGKCGYVCRGACGAERQDAPMSAEEILAVVKQERYPNFLFRAVTPSPSPCKDGSSASLGDKPATL